MWIYQVDIFFKSTKLIKQTMIHITKIISTIHTCEQYKQVYGDNTNGF